MYVHCECLYVCDVLLEYKSKDIWIYFDHQQGKEQELCLYLEESFANQ